MRVRVLIVEDSSDDAELELRELRRAGFEVAHEQVFTGASMEEALAREQWDLIIADYNMPGFTGMMALEILNRSGRDIPFILVSGTVGEDAAVEAMKAGAHD